MNEQLSIFDFLKQQKPQKILSVGDKIGRVVLGECRIATITKVEGLPNYSVKEGMTPVEELIGIAEKERIKYNTIIPKGLSERITVEYKSRHTGAILWAQIGILENMLFWKEEVTYQFLELYDSEKSLEEHMRTIRKKSLMIHTMNAKS